MPRAVIVLAIVAAAVLLAALGLPFLIDANQFRPRIEAELTKSLGRAVKIGDLKLNIWSGTVAASELSVADDPLFSHTSFLRAKSLTLSVDLRRMLFSRRLRVDGMTIDSPETMLIQAPSGVWNFSSLRVTTSGAGEATLSVKSLRINGARLSLTMAGGKPEIVDNVSIDARDFAPGAAFPFSLSAKIAGGGDLALDGKAGPVDPGDAAATPITANLRITNLNLAASGAVPGSSGIDGLLSVEGTIASHARAFKVAAKLKVENLRLAPRGTAVRNPLLLDFAMTEDLRQHSGEISRGDAAIGGLKAALTGTWLQQGESPVLRMLLSAPSVPVSEFVELLPALNIVLPSGSALEGGTATAKLTLTGPPSAVVIEGPVSIRNTRLKGFDLGAMMSPIERLAGLRSGPDTEIQALSANLLVGPGGTNLRSIRVIVPAVGEFSGDGTISPAHALDFRMQGMVRSNLVASALAPASIPFSIGGTASAPQFRPDVGQIASEEINRGIKGVKLGGADAGKTAGNLVQGLFGGKKKK